MYPWNATPRCFLFLDKCITAIHKRTYLNRFLRPVYTALVDHRCERYKKSLDATCRRCAFFSQANPRETRYYYCLLFYRLFHVYFCSQERTKGKNEKKKECPHVERVILLRLLYFFIFIIFLLHSLFFYLLVLTASFMPKSYLEEHSVVLGRQILPKYNSVQRAGGRRDVFESTGRITWTATLP